MRGWQRPLAPTALRNDPGKADTNTQIGYGVAWQWESHRCGHIEIRSPPNESIIRRGEFSSVDCSAGVAGAVWRSVKRRRGSPSSPLRQSRLWNLVFLADGAHEDRRLQTSCTLKEVNFRCKLFPIIDPFAKSHPHTISTSTPTSAAHCSQHALHTDPRCYSVSDWLLNANRDARYQS